MSEHAPKALRLMRPLFQAGEGGETPTSALQLWVEPVAFRHAVALNRLWHSRLPGYGRGCIQNQSDLCYGAEFGGVCYAVAIWSNPVARKLPQVEWLELRRLAVAPDAPRNTASRMLAVMARLIPRYRPLVTTLVSYHDEDVHTGGIYRAAGWTPTARKGANGWDVPTRPRNVVSPLSPKQRWEKVIRPEQ